MVTPTINTVSDAKFECFSLSEKSKTPKFDFSLVDEVNSKKSKKNTTKSKYGSGCF